MSIIKRTKRHQSINITGWNMEALLCYYYVLNIQVIRQKNRSIHANDY